MQCKKAPCFLVFETHAGRITNWTVSCSAIWGKYVGILSRYEQSADNAVCPISGRRHQALSFGTNSDVFSKFGLDFREVQRNVLIPSFHCNPCIDNKDKDYWDYWLELIGKSHIFNTQSVIIDNNISVVIVLLPQFWFVKVQNWICFVLEKHTGQSQAPEVKENTNTQEKT